MRILVCVKQVPDTAEIKIDPVTNTLIRAGVPSIVNPFDACALEVAARIKDADPSTEITLLSMGPDQAKDALRECLAVGGDKAYLCSDRKFGGSDTLATSYILASAIQSIEEKEGKFDLILAGKQAIDGDTAQVGPQIAEHLGIPVISYAEGIEVDGDSVIVKRQYEDRHHMLKAKMPVLITALSELNEPRYMTPGGIFDACDAEITTWGRANLVDVEDGDLGLKGSPTKIAKASDKVRKGAGEKVTPDSPDEAVDYIMDKLLTKHVI